MLCSTILNTAEPIVAKTLDIVDTFTRFIRCIRNESVNRRRIMIFNSHKPEIYLDSPLHTLRLISAYNCSNPLNRVAAEYAEPEAELFCGSPPNITPLPATFLEFFEVLRCSVASRASLTMRITTLTRTYCFFLRAIRTFDRIMRRDVYEAEVSYLLSRSTGECKIQPASPERYISRLFDSLWSFTILYFVAE